MTYKQKTCQYCATSHKKRGPFCSKACSNKARGQTAETREKISKALTIASVKPETKEKQWHNHERFRLEQGARTLLDPTQVELDPENLYLPPMFDEKPDGSFSDGKDLWFES